MPIEVAVSAKLFNEVDHRGNRVFCADLGVAMGAARGEHGEIFGANAEHNLGGARGGTGLRCACEGHLAARYGRHVCRECCRQEVH